MEVWKDRVALVTGGGGGIGEGIATKLVSEGMKVAVTVNKTDRIEDLESNKFQDHITVYPCDLTQENEVVELLKSIKEKFGQIHILVNNAGKAIYTKVTECKLDDWRRMFDINVMAVGMVTREALPIMADDGIIINMSGSIAAADVGKHVYNASKYAMRLISDGIRAELADLKPKMRVTVVTPGAVAAEISTVGGWLEPYPKRDYKDVPFLRAEDVGEAVVKIITMEPNVLIADIVIRPLGESY